MSSATVELLLQTKPSRERTEEGAWSGREKEKRKRLGIMQHVEIFPALFEILKSSSEKSGLVRS